MSVRTCGKKTIRGNRRVRGETGNDRPTNRPHDARPFHSGRASGLSDRFHANRHGVGLWLLRLLRPPAHELGLRQPNIRSLRPEHLLCDVQRRAGGRATLPIHGIRRGESEHRQPAVLLLPASSAPPARLHGRGGPGDLRALRDGHRHHRRRGHPDGHARLPRHAGGPLRPEVRLRRDLRGRLPGHPDPAQHHADRLRGHRRDFAAAALRRRALPRHAAGRFLHDLRGDPRDHQPEPGAKAKG